MKKLLLKSWKTTAAGVATIIMLLLTNFGVIEPDAQNEAITLIDSIIENIDALVYSLAAVVLLFSKDGDQKED